MTNRLLGKTTLHILETYYQKLPAH